MDEDLKKNGTTDLIDKVAKLIELTQEGKLSWEVTQPARHLRDQTLDEYAEIAFQTSLENGKLLRLTPVNRKIEKIEFSRWDLALNPLLRPARKWRWATVPELEVVDANGNQLWRFPHVKALEDLLSSVRYRVAGVEHILDRVMSMS